MCYLGTSERRWVRKLELETDLRQNVFGPADRKHLAKKVCASVF